jgi:hypothetical protein
MHTPLPTLDTTQQKLDTRQQRAKERYQSVTHTWQPNHHTPQNPKVLKKLLLLLLLALEALVDVQETRDSSAGRNPGPKKTQNNTCIHDANTHRYDANT